LTNKRLLLLKHQKIHDTKINGITKDISNNIITEIPLNRLLTLDFGSTRQKGELIYNFLGFLISGSICATIGAILLIFTLITRSFFILHPMFITMLIFLVPGVIFTILGIVRMLKPSKFFNLKLEIMNIRYNDPVLNGAAWISLINYRKREDVKQRILLDDKDIQNFLNAINLNNFYKLIILHRQESSKNSQ
jgi:hypothetical protein